MTKNMKCVPGLYFSRLNSRFIHIIGIAIDKKTDKNYVVYEDDKMVKYIEDIETFDMSSDSGYYLVTPIRTGSMSVSELVNKCYNY